MNFKRLAAYALSAALGVGSLVAVEATTMSAQAGGCFVASTWYTTPKKGQAVWIPTSGYSTKYGSNWKQGPATLSISNGDGVSTSNTKGSSNSVGGGGSIGIKGIASISGQYNHTWDQSTTSTTSSDYNEGFTLSIPKGATGRVRVYKAGWKFPTIQHIDWAGPHTCARQTRQPFTSILPVKSNKPGAYLWAVELYSKRNQVIPR